MARTSQLGSSGGIHFKEPWQFMPMTPAAAALEVFDSASVTQASSTVAFFTELARRGLQDTTNWTSDTYKTLLSVSSGKGLVAALVGPTAGGASTTTFRITVDGAASTVAIVVASGERAILLPGYGANVAMFTTSDVAFYSANEALDTDKATFADVASSASYIMPWWFYTMFGTPLLRFNTSLLIEAKHSASITNSTATAYSGAMYRLGL